MRMLLMSIAVLTMALVSGVAMARFTIHGSLTSDDAGLVMPSAALHPYYELCGSCGGGTADAAVADQPVASLAD